MPLDPENPEVPPGSVHQPPESYTHPVYPMPNPAEPTKRPMPNPQRTEVTPGQVDEPINPYLYPYYPMATPKEPTNKPLPNPPYPEVTPGPLEKPTDPYSYPLYHMPSPNEPTNKPMPNPQNHEVTPGEVEQSTDLYPNPLYPMLSPQEPTKKPLPTPQKPEVPPDAVEHPANAYPYPLYPTSSPGVQSKKPFKPQISPLGPLNQSPNPYQYPFYLKPGPNDPAKKPIPNPWLIKPRQPKVPHGHFKQPSDPYPFPRYSRPNPKEPAKTQMPDPWPFKPPDHRVAHGQVKQPSKPYLFPPYPQPSPKEPAKKPMLEPSLLKPAAPLSHVEQRPVYAIWHENKLRAKLDHPPALSLPPSLVQQPHNPYLVYPMPNPELPQKPIPLSHPPDSKQPEIPGHVHQPAKPFPPFNVGAVINNPPKPEVPGNAYWPLEPHTPVKPPATHVDTQKPKDEQSATIQPLEGKMPHPQWQQSITLPPAKEPEQAPPPPQHTDVAVVPRGSSGCVQLCAVGFSSCCPQITFHQHLYLASHGPSDEVTDVVSQEFPFVASKHFGPRTHIGHTVPDQKPDEEKYNPEKASDSLPNKNQPYHHVPGVNSAFLSGSAPYKEAVPRRESYTFLGPKPNSQYSSLPYERSPNLPQSISPQDMPFGVQNSFYIPVNQEAQNKQSKKPNDQLRVFNYWPRPNARSPLTPYLEQRNPNGMTSPRGFSFGSHWPSHLGVQEELGPLFPYSMLNDAESTKNSSFAQNLTHSSRRKKHKKSSTRDPTGRLSEPKAYILLQRGPPGKEPRRSPESPNNFRVLPNQDVPGQPIGKPLHPEHVSTRNLKSLLEGLFKSSQNRFQPRKSQTNTALHPGSKQWSSTDTDWTVALKERVTS
ncbi:ras-associated and pleckstrin homology domains-containing protein 1-like [Hippocampus zosterae]|uniref:ras-associated and pleckstrin homology domains-containing protein 1-like n=1 Tax=Hippocampus zosterae TaxID=109293 RepID=UPI00223E7F4E|nr:ras-associated and pleckstrin homology domains-containing protein 1-like [Hippocampus zosterae]